MTTWMIVEDEPDIYEVLLAMFEMWGIEGVAFVDGEEAIAWIDDVDAGRFEGEIPEVALLDIRLPGNFNGVMVGERLRKSPKLRHIAVILNTAYKVTDEEEAEFFRVSGADKIFYKPLPKFNDLKLLIEDVIARRKITPAYFEEPEVPKASIFVVDDEEGICYSVSKILRYAGYTATTMSSGEKLLRFFQKNPDNLPAVVLSDVRMPGISGIDLLHTIKANPHWQHIPVILMTGYHSNATHQEAQSSHAAGYLLKPFSKSDLKDLIERALTKNPIYEVHFESDESSDAKAILIVEDEASLRKDVDEMLTFEGYKVMEAVDGLEALQILFSSPFNKLPDLVLCDIMMPGINGYHVLAEVRKQPKLNHIPFIFLTARKDIMDRRRGFDEGANDFITKPFDATELLEAIQTQLKRFSKLKTFTQVSTRALVVVNTDKNQTKSALFSELENANIDITITYLKDMNFSIALCDPDLLIVTASNVNLAIAKIRNFELSSTLPVLVISDQATILRFDSDFYQADGFSLPLVSDIVASINQLVKQYETPTLVETGVAWKILIVSPNVTLQQQITAELITNYYIEMVSSDNLIDCFTHLEQQTDLLILDTQVFSKDPIERVINQIRKNTDVPMILIASEDMYTPQQQLEWGIHAIWSVPIIKGSVKITIERLLRYRFEPKSLTESWAQYHIFMTEAKYEASLRDEQPQLAGIMHEVSALYSGLIHDLRNSIYSLNSQITVLKKRLKDSLSDVTTLQQTVDYVALLLEQLANGRFKGVWSPKQQEGMVLSKIMEQAITFMEKAYPDTTFLFENKLNEDDPPVIIDDAQVLNTFTSVLGALAKTVPYIVITLSLSQNYQIAFSPAEWTNEIALQFLHSNNQENVLEYNLGLLSAGRLIRRHRGRLSVEENYLVLSLPTGGWKNEPTLRVEIAQAADHYEELHEQLSTQEQSDKQPISVAPLITETAVELVHWFSEVVRQAYSLGEAGRRLQLASRFGLLLASNLLVTSAGYQPQPRAVPLEPVLNNLYQLREDRLKHCTVTIQVDPDTPPVLADEIGLMQILVNLVTNALEAMSGTGDLSINAAPHAEGVQIRISDTGSGIPPEQLDRIFDLFYTTKQGQERGVGLHVVTSIVKQFGGQMDVQSTVGEGTTFTIILPAASD